MKLRRSRFPALTITNTVIELNADGDFGPDGSANCPATTRLSNRAPVEISGNWFHLELLEVDENGKAVNPSLAANVDAVATLCGARPAEITIKGKNYVTVLFPHER